MSSSPSFSSTPLPAQATSNTVLSGGSIAGIVVGATAALVAAAAVGWLLARRRSSPIADPYDVRNHHNIPQQAELASGHILYNNKIQDYKPYRPDGGYGQRVE